VEAFADLILAAYTPQAGDLVYACTRCSRRMSGEFVSLAEVSSWGDPQPIRVFAQGFCTNCRQIMAVRPAA